MALPPDKQGVTLRGMDTDRLLALYVDILAELQDRGVLRSNNIPTGDYAEWLVSEALGMRLLEKSHRGVDAIDRDERKVQIKARRITGDNPSLQVGTLRNYAAAEFDDLIAVLFDDRYALIAAYRIPHAVIAKYARPDKHQNGLRLLLDKIRFDPDVADITDDLAASKLCAISEKRIQ